MKTLNLTTVLVIIFLVLFIPQTGFTQTIPDATQPIKQAAFFQTLLRTPFAIFTGAITFICIILTGVFESIGFVLSGFEYRFPVTRDVINIGWKTVVADWWWRPAVWWHLIVGFFFFLIIVRRR